MTNGHTGIGDVFMDEFLNMLEFANTVVDKIYLTIARHLEIDSIGDDLDSKGMDLGLNGIAVRRRCLDDTEIAGTNERELEGTGNRRSRHGKGINARLHLAQFLLSRDAELLLLVDDEQAKVLEFDGLAD